MRMGWAGHVAYIGGDEKCILVVEKSEVRRPLRRKLYIDGKIILKFILKNRKISGFIWLRIGAIGELLRTPGVGLTFA
jgi:hypothetical protein